MKQEQARTDQKHEQICNRHVCDQIICRRPQRAISVNHMKQQAVADDSEDSNWEEERSLGENFCDGQHFPNIPRKVENREVELRIIKLEFVSLTFVMSHIEVIIVLVGNIRRREIFQQITSLAHIELHQKTASTHRFTVNFHFYPHFPCFVCDGT